MKSRIAFYASDSCTLLVCPGICNSSEKKYIRTFVQHAVDCGYCVIVLNHIGSLSSVKLTSPKIFTYGLCYILIRLRVKQTVDPIYG